MAGHSLNFQARHFFARGLTVQKYNYPWNFWWYCELEVFII